MKINTVNPLYASYGLPASSTESNPPATRHHYTAADLLLLAPPTPLLPPPLTAVNSVSSISAQNGADVKRGLCNVSAEFSLGALEAMAVLKQRDDHSPVRSVASVHPQLEMEPEKKKVKSEEDAPMDLSESSVTHSSASRHYIATRSVNHAAVCEVCVYNRDARSVRDMHRSSTHSEVGDIGSSSTATLKAAV